MPISDDIETHVNIIIFAWYTFHVFLFALFLKLYPDRKFDYGMAPEIDASFRERFFAKLTLAISLPIFLSMIYAVYTSDYSGDMREFLLTQHFGEYARRIQLVISTLSLILMLYYAFRGNRIFLLYAASFVLIETSMLSRSLIPVIYSLIVFLVCTRKKKHILMAVTSIVLTVILIGSFQGRGISSVDRIFYKLYQYISYSYVMPSYYYDDIKNVSYTSTLFGFPAIKINKFLGGRADGEFESRYLSEPYWVDWNGEYVPANVRLSTPILHYYTGGVAGLLFGVLINFLILLFIYQMFSPYVMAVFFYLMIGKGVYIFPLNGPYLIASLVLIIVFLNRYAIDSNGSRNRQERE